eukprot:186518_1
MDFPNRSNFPESRRNGPSDSEPRNPRFAPTRTSQTGAGQIGGPIGGQIGGQIGGPIGSSQRFNPSPTPPASRFSSGHTPSTQRTFQQPSRPSYRPPAGRPSDFGSTSAPGDFGSIQSGIPSTNFGSRQSGGLGSRQSTQSSDFAPRQSVPTDFGAMQSSNFGPIPQGMPQGDLGSMQGDLGTMRGSSQQQNGFGSMPAENGSHSDGSLHQRPAAAHGNTQSFLGSGFDGLASGLGGSLGMGLATDFANQHFGSSISTVQRSIDPANFKTYFRVNNSYVFQKMRLLLFPFRVKRWRREFTELAEKRVYLPPREDVNAPDLYIPLMAFVTYVLMMGYIAHSTPELTFDPQMLGKTASSALILLFVEIVIVKFGLYLVGENVSAPSITDMVAYSGYKFVCVVLNLVVYVLSWMSMAYYAAVVYTGVCLLLFISQTLRKRLNEDLSVEVHQNPNPAKRSFLLIYGITQPLLCLFLAWV